MTMTHREALTIAMQASINMGGSTCIEDDLDSAIRAYVEARGLVLVPRDRVEKLLEYADSDYVPNVLFDQFRAMLAAAPDPFTDGE